MNMIVDVKKTSQVWIKILYYTKKKCIRSINELKSDQK